MPTFLVLATLFAASFFLPTSPAQAADCRQPFEAGEFQNIRSELTKLNSLEIIYLCKTDKTYGNWKIRAKAKCHPRDCTWGWVAGKKDGELISATFETFNSTHHVTLTPAGQRYSAFVETTPRTIGKLPSQNTYLMIKKFR